MWHVFFNAFLMFQDKIKLSKGACLLSSTVRNRPFDGANVTHGQLFWDLSPNK